MATLKKIPPEILDECREHFAAGATDEQVIARLRQRGLSKVDTICALTQLNRADPQAAKRLVHSSETWKDVRARDERLHRTLERVAHAINREAKGDPK